MHSMYLNSTEAKTGLSPAQSRVLGGFDGIEGFEV
jgi:hypothetical protein